MIWKFSKMHGAGNDFIVINGVHQVINLTPLHARALAHRHFGIGADQILLVEPTKNPEADFRYRIFNQDGYEVEHCGNGARCFAHFVHTQRLSTRNPLRAEIANGIIVIDEKEDHQVTVDMGNVSFDPAGLLFDIQGLRSFTEGNDLLWELKFEENKSSIAPVLVSALTISNPHVVHVVEDIDTAPIETLGPIIESHPRFANRVNVGFMQVVDSHCIRLRVYERGAAETLSCGTGACAAVVSGVRRGLLQSPVSVQTRGGVLLINYQDDTIQLTGPVTFVYSGEINVYDLISYFQSNHPDSL